MSFRRAVGRLTLFVVTAIGLCPVASVGKVPVPGATASCAEESTCRRCPASPSSSSCPTGPTDRDASSCRSCIVCVAELQERESIAGRPEPGALAERPSRSADGLAASGAHRRLEVLGSSPPVHLLVVTFRC